MPLLLLEDLVLGAAVVSDEEYNEKYKEQQSKQTQQDDEPER